jgi:hypothetical protein
MYHRHKLLDLIKMVLVKNSSDNTDENKICDDGSEVSYCFQNYEDSNISELCYICGESGRSSELWFRCVPLSEWVHKEFNGKNTVVLFFFSMALPAHSGPWPLIQFRNYFSQTVGLLRRVISSSQGLYLLTGQHKHRINAYIHQTSMP